MIFEKENNLPFVSKNNLFYCKVCVMIHVYIIIRSNSYKHLTNPLNPKKKLSYNEAQSIMAKNLERREVLFVEKKRSLVGNFVCKFQWKCMIKPVIKYYSRFNKC